MTENNLREYIKNVYYLEKSLYEQKTLDRALIDEIRYYSNDANILKAVNTGGNFMEKSPINVLIQDHIEQETSYTRIKENKKNDNFTYYFESNTFYGLVILSFAIAVIIALIKSTVGKPLKWEFIPFILKYTIIISLILISIYFVKNLVCFLKERSKNKQENINIDKYNHEAIKKNKINYERRKIQLKNIAREEYHLKNVVIKNTINALNQLYKADIIFPKYRNLVAISSFYEYFESGRCNTLTGHEGAYNIYENEIRLNHIIEQLDVVIEKLDEIKRNQYMLYDAIRQTQRTNERIIKEIKTIQNQNVDILQNASISAYNSSIIAQNTEAIKWYNYISK